MPLRGAIIFENAVAEAISSSKQRVKAPVLCAQHCVQSVYILTFIGPKDNPTT
jgi:poly(3-hydroxyalkanoate) synthetase